MKTCKIPACTNPARGYGWCTEHRQNWKTYGTPTPGVPAVPALKPKLDVAEVIPSPIPASVPAGYHRCEACGVAFPVLVDGIMCIGCDSLFYPSRTWSVAS